MIGASQQKYEVHARGNFINCWFIIDISGSMSGARINAARSGLINCIGQLTKNDYIGILLFGTKTELLYQGTKENINMSKVHAVTANGGGTSLYDAIVQGGSIALQIHMELKKLCQGSPVNAITYAVLLTDGEDTDSQVTANQVRTFLQTVNVAVDFKFIMAGIQLNENARSVMRSFGAVGDRDIEFRELRSNSDIAELFEHVTVQLTQTTSTFVATDRGAVAVHEQKTVNLNSGAVSTRTAAAAVVVASPSSQPSRIASAPQRLAIEDSSTTSRREPTTTPTTTTTTTTTKTNPDRGGMTMSVYFGFVIFILICVGLGASGTTDQNIINCYWARANLPGDYVAYVGLKRVVVKESGDESTDGIAWSDCTADYCENCHDTGIRVIYTLIIAIVLSLPLMIWSAVRIEFNNDSKCSKYFCVLTSLISLLAFAYSLITFHGACYNKLPSDLNYEYGPGFNSILAACIFEIVIFVMHVVTPYE